MRKLFTFFITLVLCINAMGQGNDGIYTLIWSDDFSSYADGTHLLDAAGKEAYGFDAWGNPDSAKVIGGEVIFYPSSADANNNWFQKPIDLTPGSTYKFSTDVHVGAGKTFAVVLNAGADQVKGNEVISTTYETSSATFTVEDGYNTVLLSVYRWGTAHPVYIDNMELYEFKEFMISAVSDGVITEHAEDGEIITVTLTNDTFVASPDAANWTVSNLPVGVTVGSVNRVDDNTLELVLSGNSTENYDVDITGVTITGASAEFTASTIDLNTSTDIVFTAVLEQPVITLSDDGEIRKGAEDGEVITVILTQDTFVASLTPGNWTLTNAPAGVSIGQVNRIDDVTVELVLSGNATEDYTTDITDATVTVGAAELTNYGSDISANSGITFLVNAINWIVNGDFETGNKTGWKGYNNAVVAGEGVEASYAGRINNNADGSLLQFPLTVIPGNTYDVSFSARWPDGTGNVQGIAVVMQTLDKEKIGATSVVSSTDWSTINEQLTIPPGISEIRFVMYKGRSPLLYIDNVSMIDAGAIKPALGAYTDGEIVEGSEDGEVISVEMLNDVFAATLTPANWIIDGLPEGVTVGSVERVSDTQANIVLSGNAADYDNTLKLSLTVKGAEFVTYADDIVNQQELVFTGINEPPPAIALVPSGEILEDFEDGIVVSVQMDDDTFVNPITPANWTTLNFPEGVSIGAVERVNDTAVNVTLSGNTTGDYDLDITDAGFTIAAAEFTTWMDTVDVTGLTFIAAVEGGEEVLWEDNFDSYADGTNLMDTTGGKYPGFEFQLIDSAMIYGGVVHLHLTHALAWNSDSVDHRFEYTYDTIEVGKTYKFYIDSKTNDGAKTTASVLTGEGTQFKIGPDDNADWITRSIIVEPFLPGHDTAGCGIYNWGWNVADRVVMVDNMKLVILTEPKISLSDDGEILEGAEDGEVITVTVQNDVFAASLALDNWTISGLPEGVSAASVSRVDDNHAAITLSGNATNDYDVDITAISITASRDEFAASNKPLGTEGGVTFTAIVEPATIDLGYDGEILEGEEDGEVITVSLSLDTFVASLTPGNWTVSNLPAGVSVGEVFRVDNVTVEVVLSGNSTEDYDEDITDVTVTIAAAELTEWESDITANTGVVFTAVIENETSVEDFTVPGISAYPNPVIGQLILVADSPIEGVDVFNMLGEKTASYKDLNSSSVTLDASPWKSGVYFLDISDIDGNRSLLKVVK